MPPTQHILLAETPFSRPANSTQDGLWPCSWIGCPNAQVPFVCAFRRAFELESAATIRVHVSADERYELFLDGARIGRGPERGDPNNWFFESYDLQLSAGPHVLVARVWALGDLAPYAQLSVCPGFLLAPDDEAWIPTLGTGVAAWAAKVLGGFEFTDYRPAFGCGANLIIDGATYPWNFERGAGDDWQRASTLHAASTARRNEFAPRQLLRPAVSPPMMERECRLGKVRFVAAIDALPTHAIPIREAENLTAEINGWQQVLDGGALTIPPHTRRRVLVDLEDYLCAYPAFVTSGGAHSLLRLHWQESLYDDVNAASKGDRDAIEGKFFVCIWWPHDGLGDLFLPDGGAHRRWETLWWQCGRYLEIVVETADEPLVIESFTLRETRYPLAINGAVETDNQQLNKVNKLSLRTLQMCLHETYFDCPYYEQGNYVGDTRIEVLTTYVLSGDNRPARKALELFDASITPDGFTQSRYPSRVRNVIAPYALWHIGLVYDYSMWRGDEDFVRALMPGVRRIVDGYRAFFNPDGFAQGMTGWNNFECIADWPGGVPPQGETGVSGVLNWQFALALSWVAQLENWLGEPELAARAQRLAAELAARLEAAFWNENRGLFADDLAHQHFSQHAQCMAILSGQLSSARQTRVGENLLNDKSLTRTSLYFSHYLFEALAHIGRGDAILDDLSRWSDLEAQGFVTLPEWSEEDRISRSDCHAWSAHWPYHCAASLAGIRPGAPGFATVEIAPQLGELQWLKAKVPHPHGEIAVELRREGNALAGEITLPIGVSGTFLWQGKIVVLHGGRQFLER